MSPRRSLVARLTAVQVSVLGALWLVIIALSVHGMYERGAGDIDVELRTAAHTLAEVVPDGGNPTETARVVARFADIQIENADPALSRDEVAIQVRDANGTLRASYGSAAIDDASWYRQDAWSATRNVHVIVAKRKAYYQRRARGIALQLAGLGLAIAVLFAAAFWWSFRRVIRPIRTLADSVAARRVDDLSPVTASGAFLEIEPLLDALNVQLARLRTLLDAERRFFADAAHELRTPLSVIGAQAHVLAHEPDLPRRLDALHQIEEGIERGARLVAKLLALGRLEGAEARLELATTDIGKIAADVVAAHSALAARRGIDLQLDCPAPVAGDCAAESISVLLENLVENALNYCPAGSRVIVAVSAAGTVRLTVSDDGPGIAAADRERAFDRFQRLGATGTGGGLGLAIVRRIARLHGGEASASEGLAGRGTAITVEFPRHAPRTTARIN